MATNTSVEAQFAAWLAAPALSPKQQVVVLKYKRFIAKRKARTFTAAELGYTASKRRS